MARKKSKAPARTESEADPGAGGFRGFGAQALPFLQALRENNDRDWFAANKSIFLEELDRPMRELVGEVGARLAAHGSKLAPIARNPVYRIYRDVRFSHDKTPYKTNLGASLHRDGQKSSPGLVYIHVDPAGSFLASGFYMPETDRLKALRSAIADEPKRYLKLIRDLEPEGITPGDGDPITRMPKGFEDHAESPVADALKNRSLIVARTLAEHDLESRDLPDQVAAFALAVTPFLEFFWSRID